MTLNREKCRLNLSKINFFGLVLSAKGIGPVEDKVKAVTDTYPPNDGQEVKSLLGLVNYNGRFISDLDTISESLRKLTRKGAKFYWGKDRSKHLKN